MSSQTQKPGERPFCLFPVANTGNPTSPNEEVVMPNSQPIPNNQDLPDSPRQTGTGEVVPVADVDSVLAEHANIIRKLGKRVKEDVIEIGRRLKECKQLAGRGNWSAWLEREFGWSERTAQRYMQLYEFTQEEFQYDKLSVLELPLSGLYLLAAPSTPDEACNEIIQRAAAGEAISLARVRDTISRNKRDKEPASIPNTDAETEEKEEELDEEGDIDEGEVEDEEKGEEDRKLTKKSRRISRRDRWLSAVSAAESALGDLLELQQQYQEWRDNQPENFQGTIVDEKLNAMCDLDLQSALDTIQEAAGLDLPQGFWRD
jgi:Protein of unknown function (DUF3102)